MPCVPVWVLEHIGACLKDVHGAQDWGPALLEGPSCGNSFSLKLCGQAGELGWAELVERPGVEQRPEEGQAGGMPGQITGK